MLRLQFVRYKYATLSLSGYIFPDYIKTSCWSKVFQGLCNWLNAQIYLYTYKVQLWGRTKSQLNQTPVQNIALQAKNHLTRLLDYLNTDSSVFF